jgi:hypothetical protein
MSCAIIVINSHEARRSLVQYIKRDYSHTSQKTHWCSYSDPERYKLSLFFFKSLALGERSNDCKTSTAAFAPFESAQKYSFAAFA